MFCGPKSRVHKTYCFSEVSVNKYFIIYQESKKRKDKTIHTHAQFKKSGILASGDRFLLARKGCWLMVYLGPDT